MKKIMIPMDFTPVSMNALKFAYNMMKGGEFHIVHSTISLPAHKDTYVGTNDTKSTILHRELTNMVINVLDVEELPNNFIIKILIGETIASLRIYEKENDIDLLFIGTRDKYDLLDKWVGTISLGILKTLKSSAYLIPPFAKYKGFDKVLVATDDKLQDPNFVKAIKTWNKDHLAFIKFLQIRRNNDENIEKQMDSIIKEFFYEGEPKFVFEISAITSREITQSLLASAYNFGADLLISLPNDQSFIQSLLFKSISKELVLKSEIPMYFIKKQI